jgi:hypothetical protein
MKHHNSMYNQHKHSYVDLIIKPKMSFSLDLESQVSMLPTVENVHVVCRLRPFSEEEKLKSVKNIAILDGGQTITIMPKQGLSVFFRCFDVLILHFFFFFYFSL